MEENIMLEIWNQIPNGQVTPDIAYKYAHRNDNNNHKEIRNMKIKKNITIELSENDVKEIIAEYLRTKGYEVAAKDVDISVGMQMVGPYMDERYEACFNGVSVKCKEE